LPIKSLLSKRRERKTGCGVSHSQTKRLAFQNVEKKKRAAELVIANKELAFQNIERKTGCRVNHCQQRAYLSEREKEKRAAELIIANKELIFQNEEKENGQQN